MAYKALTELVCDAHGVLQSEYPIQPVGAPKVLHLCSAPTLKEAFGGRSMFDDNTSAENLLTATFERNLAHLVKVHAPLDAQLYVVTRKADGRIDSLSTPAKVDVAGLLQVLKIHPPHSYVAVQYYRYTSPNNPSNPITLETRQTS